MFSFSNISIHLVCTKVKEDGLIFNILWTLVFFYLHQTGLALLVILTLVILIERTLKWFGTVDRLSKRLLIPYLIWVLFATYLNAGVWWLNV